MTPSSFSQRLKTLRHDQQALLERPNPACPDAGGLYQRFAEPVLTPAHVPLEWRYDLDPSSNPRLLERLGINAVFNAGAIKLAGRYLLVARVEGWDRKSFFAVAESDSGTSGFQFWPEPILLPETSDPDVNVYDMRLTHHEDGWIYGVFCTERKDPRAPAGDLSSAIAQAGIVRTHDLKHWERLADLRTRSAQQRNVVLHPEFVSGKYAFYTRPQDDFIEAGSGGGISWGLADSIEQAVIEQETLIDERRYHTIKESKNGQGPPPIKTAQGWLHLAHGVRNTAAGLRYVLYLFMTSLEDPARLTHSPAGYFIAPQGAERVGDVSNVVFSNGWIADADGRVLIYYASSDTRLHVAETSQDILLDYCMNTPADGLRSGLSVKQRLALIHRNRNQDRAG